MSSLERLAIGFLSATLLAYLAVAGNRYLIGAQQLDLPLLTLAFAFLARLKIGLDDIYYYREEARDTSHVRWAILTSIVSYLMWAVVPFLLVSEFRAGILLLSWTVMLSTASIAFTAIGLEEQLKKAKGVTGAVTTYSSLKRFYDEQPRWIIMNCLYESLLLALFYFDKMPTGLFISLSLILIVAVLWDLFRSDSIGYVIGKKGASQPVVCAKEGCNTFLGDTKRYDAFCPNCGTRAVV